MSRIPVTSSGKPNFVMLSYFLFLSSSMKLGIVNWFDVTIVQVNKQTNTNIWLSFHTQKVCQNFIITTGMKLGLLLDLHFWLPFWKEHCSRYKTHECTCHIWSAYIRPLPTHTSSCSLDNLQIDKRREKKVFKNLVSVSVFCYLLLCYAV